MGFFQKVRALTLGAAHDLADKAIDLNSPSMLRQYVRDLEDAIGKMNTEAAVQTGQVATLKREYSTVGAKIASDTAWVKSNMESNPTAARTRATLIVENQKHFDQMGVDINNQQKVADEINAAVSNLKAKHDLMVSRVRELERLDRDSKAKESAASAMNQAGSILNTVGSQSIDDLQERMQRRHDVANAKFDQSMASAAPEENTNSEEVDALLASLKG